MKGIMFNVFGKLVEEKFGLAVWDEILGRVDPKSGGAYTSVDTYSDEEMVALVVALSDLTGISLEDLLRTYGEYALEPLVQVYPDSVKDGTTLKIFLRNVHAIVHAEVKKLYADAKLPTFEYEEPAEDQLIMIYRSARNLPSVAEGLIDGAAKFFSEKIARKTIEVKENDETYYRFEITFLGSA
jgi:hypothetical protein